MVDTSLMKLGERMFEKFKYLYESAPESLKVRETQWMHNVRILRIKDYGYLRRNVFGRYRWLEQMSYTIHIMDFDTPLFGCFEHTITIVRIKI